MDVIFDDLHQYCPSRFFESHVLPSRVRGRQMYRAKFCAVAKIGSVVATLSLKAHLQASHINIDAFRMSLLTKCLRLSMFPLLPILHR